MYFHRTLISLSLSLNLSFIFSSLNHFLLYFQITLLCRICLTAFPFLPPVIITSPTSLLISRLVQNLSIFSFSISAIFPAPLPPSFPPIYLKWFPFSPFMCIINVLFSVMKQLQDKSINDGLPFEKHCRRFMNSQCLEPLCLPQCIHFHLLLPLPSALTRINACILHSLVCTFKFSHCSPVTQLRWFLKHCVRSEKP